MRLAHSALGEDAARRFKAEVQCRQVPLRERLPRVVPGVWCDFGYIARYSKEFGISNYTWDIVE